MKKIGVVGVGHLGKRHLENLMSLNKAFCAGFYDKNINRANQLENETGAKKFFSIQELLDQSEAIIIAVPTSDHYKVGRLCLESGKHVFIEKPICANIAEAEAMVELANRKLIALLLIELEEQRFL